MKVTGDFEKNTLYRRFTGFSTVLTGNLDGSEYNGEWLKGTYHGNGRFVTSTGAVYEGNWAKGT